MLFSPWLTQIAVEAWHGEAKARELSSMSSQPATPATPLTALGNTQAGD